MHYAPHALLNCVAWFSLLCYGNAAKAAAPSELLSHFARTVGTALGPSLTTDLNHASRLNRSTGEQAQNRNIEPRQVSRQDPGNVDAAAAPQTGAPQAPSGIPQLGFPYQYERTYQYRYPPYSQHFAQSFFPGAGAPGFGNQLPGGDAGGLPIDPRQFFQGHAGSHSLAPINPEIPKPLSGNINANGNESPKDNGNSNANSIQNLDGNVDSKSSAQNRPFPDSPNFPNQPAGLDPSNGNLRVNNRFSAIDYERIRQNYYSDPPINQQRNYFSSSFNEIPFAGGGPPYRSPLAERYSNLDYSGGPARAGGPSSDLRSSNGLGGIGEPYFGSFLQGPYQSLNYNSLPGGGGGGSDPNGPPFSDNFERSDFRSPFNNLQYPSGGPAPFNAPFYPPEFNEAGVGAGPGDSSLRASSSKATLTGSPSQEAARVENRSEKVRFEEEGKERKEGSGQA